MWDGRQPEALPSQRRLIVTDEVDAYLVNLKNGACRVAGLMPKNHARLRTADERIYTNFVEASNGVVVGNVANHLSIFNEPGHHLHQPT